MGRNVRERLSYFMSDKIIRDATRFANFCATVFVFVATVCWTVGLIVVAGGPS